MSFLLCLRLLIIYQNVPDPLKERFISELFPDKFLGRIGAFSSMECPDFVYHFQIAGDQCSLKEIFTLSKCLF